MNTPPEAPHTHTSPLHLQVVQRARLRARDEPGPVHRDALQWAGRVEDAAALLEAQGRAVALRDRARPRRVERAAVALALLDELQSVWVGAGRGARAFFAGNTHESKGGDGMGVVRVVCVPAYLHSRL